MSPSVIGMFIGLLLGVAARGDGGLTSVLVALAFGVVGYLVGGQLSGQFDLREILKGRDRD